MKGRITEIDEGSCGEVYLTVVVDLEKEEMDPKDVHIGDVEIKYVEDER